MRSITIGTWSPYHGQTGNTTNCVALSVRMAFTHTLKILLMHNTPEKSGMERAFYDAEAGFGLADISSSVLRETGIDAVIKLMRTGQLDEASFVDYVSVLAKDRLEMLVGSRQTDSNARNIMQGQIQTIIDCAKRRYDMIFLDIASGTSTLSDETMSVTDLILVSLNQNEEVLTSYFSRRDWCPTLDLKPHILLVGNFDESSAWSIARIRKTYGYQGEIYPIPRYSKWLDAHNDHKVLELFSGITPKMLKKSFVDATYFHALDTVIKRILFMSGLDENHTFNPLETRTLFDKLLKIR